MSYAESTLPEFDHEMAITRKLLERLPESLLDWRPNEKSNTIGWNANHLVEIVGWVEGVLTESSFDIDPVGGPPYATPNLSDRQTILDQFDQNVAQARAAIAAVDDHALGEMWSLFERGKELFTMPRGAVVRTFVISHLIHHRAILSVYYRLNQVPVPAIYGPTADDTQSP